MYYVLYYANGRWLNSIGFETREEAEDYREVELCGTGNIYYLEKV